MLTAEQALRIQASTRLRPVVARERMIAGFDLARGCVRIERSGMRLGVLCRGIKHDFRCIRLSRPIADDKSEPQVADPKLVTSAEDPFVDPHSIDVRAVRAPQVAHEDRRTIKRQTAMPPRDPRRVELHVATAMAADKRQNAFERNLGIPIEGDQARQHGQRPYPKDGDRLVA
jgi:hypothetical protein